MGVTTPPAIDFPVFDDRIPTPVAEMQDDRRGRPVDSVEKANHLDLETLILRAQRGARHFLHVPRVVLPATRSQPGCLPLRDRQELVAGQVPLPACGGSDDILDGSIRSVGILGRPLLDFRVREPKLESRLVPHAAAPFSPAPCSKTYS